MAHPKLSCAVCRYPSERACSQQTGFFCPGSLVARRDARRLDARLAIDVYATAPPLLGEVLLLQRESFVYYSWWYYYLLLNGGIIIYYFCYWKHT